jgi:hypothetical protein
VKQGGHGKKANGSTAPEGGTLKERGCEVLTVVGRLVRLLRALLDDLIDDSSLRLNFKFKRARVPLTNRVDSLLCFLARRKDVGAIARPDNTRPHLGDVGWSQWFADPAEATVVRLSDDKSHDSPRSSIWRVTLVGGAAIGAGG